MVVVLDRQDALEDFTRATTKRSQSVHQMAAMFAYSMSAAEKFGDGARQPMGESDVPGELSVMSYHIYMSWNMHGRFDTVLLFLRLLALGCMSNKVLCVCANGLTVSCVPPSAGACCTAIYDAAVAALVFF